MDRAEIINIVESVVERVLRRVAGERRYVRIATAALWYDFEPRELRERCVSGEIDGAAKDGKEWRIPVASLERMLGEGERNRKRHRRKGVKRNDERGVESTGGGEGRGADEAVAGEAGGVCGG